MRRTRTTGSRWPTTPSAEPTAWASCPSTTLSRWQDATWWLGQADRALELAEIVSPATRRRGPDEPRRAGGHSLGFLLMLRGDLAAGSGWIQRGRSAARTVAGRGSPLVRRPARRGERPARRRPRPRPRAGSPGGCGRPTGFRLHPALARADDRGDRPAARRRSGPGMALLDEAMLPVRAGRIPPDLAGNLYCQMIGRLLGTARSVPGPRVDRGDGTLVRAPSTARSCSPASAACTGFSCGRSPANGTVRPTMPGSCARNWSA